MAKLYKIHDGDKSKITIFVHGFLAVSSQYDCDELIHFILRARPTGQVYLLVWESGKLENLKDLVLSYRNYRRYRKQAEIIGMKMKRHIAAIPGSANIPISLVGHSLGASIIYHALAEDDWSRYNIQDIVFMGGAIEVNYNEMLKIMLNTHGGLYNGYSDSDQILKIAPGTSRFIGRNRLFFTRKRNGHQWVFNVKFPDIGHTDYWSNLEHVLEWLWPSFVKRVPFTKEEA